MVLQWWLIDLGDKLILGSIVGFYRIQFFGTFLK
jgi:hypothetical protein